MTDMAMENARKKLAAAQAVIDALSRIPFVENYPLGTVVRWRKGDQWRAAIKTRPDWPEAGVGWEITGRSTTRPDNRSWAALRSAYLTSAVDQFEVASGWGDATQEPPLDVKDDGYTLTDTGSGLTWTRRGDEWVRQ